MTTFLIIIHVLVSFALIAIVLLQGGGKGAEMGATFGAGGSNTVFGASGGQNFLSKLTTAAAVIFMLTSLTLAYFYGMPGGSSIMPETVAPQVETPAAPALPAPAEAPAAPAEKK